MTKENRKNAKDKYLLGGRSYNRHRYGEARDRYLEAINLLINAPLEDDDYRLLMRCFINLSDTYIQLNLPEQSAEQFLNCQKAFKAISEKTEEELALGNIDKNVLAFRDFVEKQSSNPSFFVGNEYKKNGKILSRNLDEAILNTSMSSLNSLSMNSTSIGPHFSLPTGRVSQQGMYGATNRSNTANQREILEESVSSDDDITMEIDVQQVGYRPFGY